MAIIPAENTEWIHYIEPKGVIIPFDSEDHYIEKGTEWKLFTARSVKREFLYKGAGNQTKVTIAGYEEYGNGLETIVVEFENGKQSCIHPAYLKEMQSTGFGKELLSGVGAEPVMEEVPEKEPAFEMPDAVAAEPVKKETQKVKKKKESKPKLDLPADKVHFEATVKEFTAKMNHFTGEEDEVILLENVKVIEPELTIGDAWCGYSKTLKKAELQEGDKLEFDGKVVEKKFNKEIKYKVNNPSKLKKAEE